MMRSNLESIRNLNGPLDFILKPMPIDRMELKREKIYWLWD
jgi:hypothetical protein